MVVSARIYARQEIIKQWRKKQARFTVSEASAAVLNPRVSEPSPERVDLRA
jgi:hypothetical protein